MPDPGLLEILRCPACSVSALERVARGKIACAQCGTELERGAGYWDLLDLPGGTEPLAYTTEQKLMESELVARAYERVWRPAFVRMVAGKGAGAAIGGFPGELYIHKNSLAMEDRSGPYLDVSCGPGLFARGMAAAAPGELIVGLDISRAMLEAAVKRAKGYANVAFVRADAHALPFRDEAIGGVNNAGALHAYDDPEQVFREVWRVLIPGGVYVGSTFARSRSMTGRFAARIAGIRRFDPHELRAWLSRLGFADYEEVRLGDSFVFRARKP